MRTTLSGDETHKAWLRTVERVSLTDAGHALASALDSGLDSGWSVADGHRYWQARGRNHLRVALVERAARRTV